MSDDKAPADIDGMTWRQHFAHTLPTRCLFLGVVIGVFTDCGLSVLPRWGVSLGFFGSVALLLLVAWSIIRRDRYDWSYDPDKHGWSPGQK